MTGDGIHANDNACRMMWHELKTNVVPKSLAYRLVDLICSSHASILVVKVAVCGGLVSDPVKNDPICAACSRFHKHLCGDYSEEFSRSIWEHIDFNLQLLQGMENTLSDEAVRSRHLQDQ